MKIKQTYSIRESDFGTQEINVIISDVYTDLFNGDDVDIETDIIKLESTREDLELEKLSFAVDELGFSIRETSADTEDDKNALFFCLDATKVEVERYIIIYFGTISESNLVFAGKINSKISGQDIKHDRSEWSDDLGALREYKFTALTIDFALLEQALFTDEIKDSLGNDVDNIYTRLAETDYSAITGICSTPTCYVVSNPETENVKHRPQFNLFDGINLYLDKANDIIFDLHGISVGFTFVDSELGIDVAPAEFEIDEDDYGYITAVKPDIDQLINLRICSTPNGTDEGKPYSSIHLHRGMIEPYSYNSTYTDGERKFLKHDGENEERYSWKRYKNVAELLINLARNYGCYIVKEISSTAINLKFVPRKDINLNDSIRLIGANSGTIDTEVGTNNEVIRFRELANDLFARNPNNTEYLKLGGSTLESFGVELEDKKSDFDTLDIYKKPAFIWEFIQGTLDKLKDSAIIYDLPTSASIGLVDNFTRGGSIVYGSYSGKYNSYGIRGVWLQNTHIKDEEGSGTGGGVVHFSLDERINSSVNIFCTTPETGSGTVLRPIAEIYFKHGLQNHEVGSFEEYLSRVLVTERQFYNTTYTLKAPYWNGFAEDTSGTNPSWKNLKLGTNIKLTENVIRYIDDEFQEVVLTNEFTVISIERNLQRPETTIKLALKSRFAYGYNDDLGLVATTFSMPAPDFPDTSPSIITFFDDSEVSIAEYEIETGETIEVGHAVSILPTGKAVKTKSQSTQGANILGIAYEVNNDDELVKVILSGLIRREGWSFAGIGKDVFAQTNAGNNINQTGLFIVSGSEDLSIFVGKAVTDKAILVKPEQYLLA